MRFVACIYFLLLNAFVIGQDETRFNEREIVKQQKLRSEECAKKLKTAVILFRLDFKEKEINYYRKYNNSQAADQLEAKTKKNNLAIIQSVRAKFDVCPIYFFDGASSREILVNDWEKVVFLSDSLTPLPRNQIDKVTEFFIAEYSYTRGQVVSSNRNNQEGKHEHDSTSSNPKYYENVTLRVNGFILMDSKFVPLTQPFPYYIKLMSLKKQANIQTKIQKWNRQIAQYINGL